MNEKQIAEQLRRLASEPVSDQHDPWPSIRTRMMRSSARARRGGEAPRGLWRLGAVAAALFVMVVGGISLLEAARPRPATAAEILNRMQLEAQGAAISGPMEADCREPLPNPTELTDRVGQILGISGERVRQAMRIKFFVNPAGRAPANGGFGTAPIAVAPAGGPASGAAVPVPGVPVGAPAGVAVTVPGAPGGAPPDAVVFDPIGAIARELGLSSEQVKQAFADPSCPDRFTIPFPGSADEMYRAAAQRLGVAPERLAHAVRSSAAAPPAGAERAPASPDEMIARMAAELGVTPERLRAVLQEAGAGFGERRDFLLPR
jgi:hypothetical protein